MIRFAPFVVILQVFCLYHAYANKSDQKWYWAIIFFPLLGSLFYLYHHFYNRRNVAILSENVKSVMNTNYELEKLEKEFQFSDTDLNKSRLADKYVQLNRYDDAITLYESCLQGYNQDDPETIKKLIEVNYLKEDYAKTIAYGKLIADRKEFSKSKEKVFYAWALNNTNNVEKAEQIFKSLDSTFTNYSYRIEYSKFLNEIGKAQEALKKLEELSSEFNLMEPTEKKQYRSHIKLVRQLYDEFGEEE